jgi:transcription elongation factor GreB
MSKAFTRELDDAPEPAPVSRPLAISGGKNYLTPASAERLRAELEQLTKSEALAAVASPESRLRLLYLQQSLAIAVVVLPPAPPWEQVLFGATVTVRDNAGELSQYRIVGIDETDLDRNWVSWSSPVARALLKARLGQKIKFRTPAGEQNLEITSIAYE